MTKDFENQAKELKITAEAMIKDAQIMLLGLRNAWLAIQLEKKQGRVGKRGEVYLRETEILLSKAISIYNEETIEEITREADYLSPFEGRRRK